MLTRHNHGRWQFDQEAERDALHELLQQHMDAVQVTLADGSVATAAEVKAAAVKNFVAEVNSHGWGDAPEHLLCGLFRASMHLRTPAQSRVIRAVCKRWRVAHDSVMDKLKPGRWWEGPRQSASSTVGMAMVGEEQVADGETPSWASAPPTVMSLLQRFHQLTCIDLSSAEVQRPQPLALPARQLSLLSAHASTLTAASYGNGAQAEPHQPPARFSATLAMSPPGLAGCCPHV